jgi:hypothetical protein
MIRAGQRIIRAMTTAEINQLKVAQLKEELIKLDHPTTGKKVELRDRLIAAVTSFGAPSSSRADAGTSSQGSDGHSDASQTITPATPSSSLAGPVPRRQQWDAHGPSQPHEKWAHRHTRVQVQRRRAIKHRGALVWHVNEF